MGSRIHASSALLALLMPTALSCAQDRASTLTPSAARRVVEAHLAAQNAHDLNALLATLGDTVVLRVARASRPDTTFTLIGAQRGSNYERAFRAAPTSHFRVISEIVSGPWVITREEGTGLPDGKTEIGLNAYRVDHDRIVAFWLLNVEAPVSP